MKYSLGEKVYATIAIGILFILIIFSSLCSFAKEAWMCTEDSSQLKGTSYYICGVGEAHTETEARKAALINASDEYHTLCELSHDCNTHHTQVDPQRTTCSKDGDGWKCYRLVVFIMGEEIKPQDIAQPIQKAKEPEPMKVTKGMTKNQLIKLIGIPKNVNDMSLAGESDRKLFYYSSKACTYYPYNGCSVILENGLVVQYMDIKPEFTDDI